MASSGFNIGVGSGFFGYLHIGKCRYNQVMDLLEIFKALSNRTRLEILKGLKDPVKNFPPQDEGDVLTVGLCVSSIQEGVGLSQSTVSDYLATLQRAALVEVRRIGQWTYYKRNEATISALAEIIGEEL
jgi:ArsR family transcriptional regulator